MTNPIDWASDANYPAGSEAWSATPTKVAPSSGQIAAGVAPRAKLPAQWFNYIVRNLVTVLNEKLYGPGGAVTDNAIARFDGTGGSTIQQSGLTIDDSGNLVMSGVKEVNYDVARSFTTTLGLSPVRPYEDTAGAPEWYNTYTPDLSLISRVNSGTATLDLQAFIPRGSTITSVAIRANPGAARSGGNRVGLTVYTVDALTGVVNTNHGTVYDDTTANLQTITNGSLNIAVAADKRYIIAIKAGHDGATNTDSLYGVWVTYTLPGLRMR